MAEDVIRSDTLYRPGKQQNKKEKEYDRKRYSSLRELFSYLVNPVNPVYFFGTVRLGYPESVILGLGIVLIACTVLYLIPRTSVLGAILLTGYLGGAVATHVRVGEGLFPVSFPIIMGVLVWGGLWLWDERLRRLIPLRT